MRVIIYFIGTIFFLHQQLMAQTSSKITGPLGVYHTTPGYTLSDSTGIDSMPVQYEFRFGEMAIPNQASDNGFLFLPDIDSCNQWNANRVTGIIQPPTEKGVYNQQADTSLYYPFPQPDGPGMIQGGQRFSQLSKLYGPFCGVILDDWNRDTSITHEVHDALLGRYVDATGKVYSNSPATTPYNKLYCVIYDTAADPSALPFIDGVSYWYSTGQNCCYYNLDGDILTLRKNYPQKEIMIGIYIYAFGTWMQPTGIEYMLAHSLNSYDDGEINGITIFAGSELIKEFMPLSEWDSIPLGAWLDSLYFPFLGEGQGQLYDCTSHSALTDAFVRVYCKGRVSGDTLMRSRQKTNSLGRYQFGLWAGNRDTDSTYYWLIAEKQGYFNDTVGFWIKRNQSTAIPPLSLCINKAANSNDNMLVFPNPGAGTFLVEVNAGNASGGVFEVFNILGKKVYTATQPLNFSVIDISSEPEGIYVVRVTTGQPETVLQRVVILQR